MKAWTSTEGPFNFEGRFTHKRAINIWPRPYQTPHPPVWVTGSSDVGSVKKAASKGYVFATFLQTYDKVRMLFDAYRSAYKDNGQPGGGGSRVHAVALRRRERSGRGSRRARTHLVSQGEGRAAVPQSAGYVPVAANVVGLRGTDVRSRTNDALRQVTLEEQRELGVVMYGTPDQVVEQIKTEYERVGGFDHLLMMMQAGFLDHKRTVSNIKLFAKEVYPQIKDLPGMRASAALAAE